MSALRSSFPRGLRTRIAAAVAVGALTVAAGVALLLGNTVSLRNDASSTFRADAYLARVVNVERLVVDVETGLRGYVITGRGLFLAPARFARLALPAAMDQLRRAARSSGGFQAQTNALLTAVHAYLNGYVPDLLQVARIRPRTARSYVVTLVGKQQVDAIRSRAATLERDVGTSQANRQRNAQAAADSSIAEAIVILAVLTLLTLALGGYLGHLVVTRERARRRSERTTRTLQESLLPASLPAIGECELAVRFHPAGGELVGGDFYDVYETGPGRWAIVLGDVCGKGAAAASMSAMARWTLRNHDQVSVQPADALRALNTAMLRQGSRGRFITIACVALETTPDGAWATVACAGHPPPIVVPAVGDPEPVQADGDLLGIWPAIRLRSAEVRLRPGDSLVLYTDGVTDQGPELRPPPREALRGRPAGANADQLAGILEHLARSGGGSHRDDIAILAVRFLGKELGEVDAAPPPIAQTADAA